MTDLEMTRLCAKAINWKGILYPEWDGYPVSPEHVYDPFHYDAQALVLVKTFGLTVDPQEDKPPFTWRVVVANDGDWDKQISSQGNDLNRAIVECVVKMQAEKLAA